MLGACYRDRGIDARRTLIGLASPDAALDLRGRDETLAKTGGIVPAEFWQRQGVERIHANGVLPRSAACR